MKIENREIIEKTLIIEIERGAEEIHGYRFFYFNGDPKGKYKDKKDLSLTEKILLEKLKIDISESKYADAITRCNKCFSIVRKQGNRFYCFVCEEERYCLI